MSDGRMSNGGIKRNASDPPTVIIDPGRKSLSIFDENVSRILPPSPEPRTSIEMSSPSGSKRSQDIDGPQKKDEDPDVCRIEVEDIGPEEEAEIRKHTLKRKSSISMPNLEELKQKYLGDNDEKIPEHHLSTASGFSDGEGTITDTNEILSEDEDKERSPERNGHRKSGVVPTVRRGGPGDHNDDYSPGNSVTSSNSLASLLKEKLLQNIPLKAGKQKVDYRIRAFVALMFLAIAFFIGFAYTMFHQQVNAKSYFERVQFSLKGKRNIRLFNSGHAEVLKGNLGLTLGSSKAFPCLPEDKLLDGSECLEWVHKARLYLSHLPQQNNGDKVSCYTLHWTSLSDDIHPTDCYQMGEAKSHWYGGGQTKNLSWPLERGSQDFTPFITGDLINDQWGNVLTRYFVNSKGVAVIIDEESPLYVSINNDSDNKLCFQAKYDNFAYINHKHKKPELKYKLCTAENMTELHTYIHNQQNLGTPLWDGMKPEDTTTLDSLLSEPIWQIAPRLKHELTEATIYNYTEDVIDLGFLKQGHVLINEFWQNEIGDFTLDSTRFETLNETVDILHRRGFKIVFSVQPFISTESVNFAECVQQRLLVFERDNDRRVPALTRYKSLASAGLLDITNNRTGPWLLEKLSALKETYKVDAFYLDLGTAQHMPHYYQCDTRLSNPDGYKKVFIEKFEKILSIIGVSSTIHLPRPPILVSLPPLESSWDSIRMVIPTILTYGIIGYPFLMPNAVGGDIYWPGSEQYLPVYPKAYPEATASSNSTQENGIMLPEKELYIRWLQLATFLPVMKFTHLPSKYNDEEVLDLAKNLTSLRQRLVTPQLLKCKQQALEEGLPLIRPLWLAFPGDVTALSAADEFVVGDQIIVAPVLHKGHTSRDVYLPTGVWKDGIDNSQRKGNRWIHDYKVPLNKIAYFIKLADDKRLV